jgi:hypothetical protein
VNLQCSSLAAHDRINSSFATVDNAVGPDIRTPSNESGTMDRTISFLLSSTGQSVLDCTRRIIWLSSEPSGYLKFYLVDVEHYKGTSKQYGYATKLSQQTRSSRDNFSVHQISCGTDVLLKFLGQALVVRK